MSPIQSRKREKANIKIKFVFILEKMSAKLGQKPLIIKMKSKSARKNKLFGVLDYFNWEKFLSVAYWKMFQIICLINLENNLTLGVFYI